eukprot:5383459-Pleurochrysis_carterae.AAC.1
MQRRRSARAAFGSSGRSARTLDVAVEHAVLVAVGHPLEQLLHVALDLRRCEALPVRTFAHSRSRK